MPPGALLQPQSDTDDRLDKAPADLRAPASPNWEPDQVRAARAALPRKSRPIQHVPPPKQTRFAKADYPEAGQPVWRTRVPLTRSGNRRQGSTRETARHDPTRTTPTPTAGRRLGNRHVPPH